MSAPAPITPSAPDGAQRAFPRERWGLVERFVELLATDGVERGLIGPREAPRLWERHVLNSAALGQLIAQGATVADLGSGAGLPGVVLAISRPDLQVALVEPLLRRTRFLDEVVEELGLDAVEVLRGKADTLHGRRRFDVVTARALAPLDRLVGWAMPLVAPRGELLALKGASAAEEVDAAADALRAERCGPPEVSTVTGLDGSSTVTVVRVAHASARD